jgi:hypothetical protein
MSVDRVEAVRGGLRVSATMEDGSPAVSIWLDGDCEHREVGRGIATSTRFVWTLSADEVGAALGCGLRVRADGLRDEDGNRVHRIASVPVAVTVYMPRNPYGVRMVGRVAGPRASTIILRGAPQGARILARGGVVDGVVDEGARRTRHYDVPNVALARTVLAREPLELWGVADTSIDMDVSIAVGGTELESEDDEG